MPCLLNHLTNSQNISMSVDFTFEILQTPLNIILGRILNAEFIVGVFLHLCISTFCPFSWIKLIKS